MKNYATAFNKDGRKYMQTLFKGALINVAFERNNS